MKRKLFFLPFLLLLSSCSAENSSVLSSSTFTGVTVIFEDNQDYSLSQQIYQIKKGTDLKVHLDFKEDLTLDTINYQDNEIQTDESGDVDLTLKNIVLDQRIKITSKTFNSKTTTKYHLNGGSLINEDIAHEEDYFYVKEEYKDVCRINTPLGSDVIKRDGYTLIGWNTQADGSGTHVGLGSRYTVDSKNIDFYAEWAEWSQTSSFTFKILDDMTWSVTSYNGNKKDDIIIPASYKGRAVTTIGSDFAWFLDTSRVVLPSTITTVENDAFNHCTINDFYFFDNLVNIRQTAFSNESIKHIHINAIQKPVYVIENPNSSFVEKMDRLILNKDKKKMIFFAGCSMSYGLTSDIVAETFPDYVICNMGVIGGTNASFQFDCIMNYVAKDDILIHAPEEMSEFQFLIDLTFDSRCFIMVERNLDLLSMIDYSLAIKFFDGYHEFADMKSKLNPEEFTDYNPDFNSYGDYITQRSDSSTDAYYETEDCFISDKFSLDNLSLLNSYYLKLKESGVKNYFSYAPLNENAISHTEEYSEKILYEEDLNTFLQNTTIISSLDDYLMTGNYFYDTDYHLSNNGALVRTKLLIQDIQTQMEKEENN